VNNAVVGDVARAHPSLPHDVDDPGRAVVLPGPAQRVDHLRVSEVVAHAAPPLRHLLGDSEHDVEEPLGAEALHEVGERGVGDLLILLPAAPQPIAARHAVRRPEGGVNEPHRGVDVAGAEERLGEERAREGGRHDPAGGHFVEQPPRGARVGHACVPVEERGVGHGVGSRAHAEEEAVREEDVPRAAEVREQAVAVGERGRGGGEQLEEAEREERRVGAQEAAQDRVGGMRVEAARRGEEEQRRAAVRLRGTAGRAERVHQAEQVVRVRALVVQVRGRQRRAHGGHR